MLGIKVVVKEVVKEDVLKNSSKMYKAFIKTSKVMLLNSRIKKDLEIVDIEISSDIKLQNFVDTKVKLTKTIEEKESFLF